MRKAIFLAMIICSLASVPTPANAQAKQTPSASPTSAQTRDFVPTEIQRLKLENLQLKAKLAQAEQAKAQANFQGSLNELFTYSNTVRTENKWGDDVSFDVDSLKFTGTPKKDAPAKK